MRSWSERGISWSGYGVENAGAMRNTILLALSTSPNPQAFLSVASLSDVLFARIAHSFSLHGMTHPSFEHPHGSAADKQRTRERYDAQLRSAWKRSEEPWIQMALSSWLYSVSYTHLDVYKRQACAGC